jgi:hypothetical protein
MLDAWKRGANESPAVAFASVGHSSVVLKTRLASGTRVALRPRTTSSPRGYLAELAAYRVAVALGIDHVPPVVFRRLSRRELAEKLEADDAERERILGAIAWERDGASPCAAVAWIDGLQDGDLERTATWMRWLDGRSSPPQDREALADDLARTIAFDYLIGNIDRFSGGNLKLDRAGMRLVTRDHNLAFIAPLPAHHRDALRERLDRTARIPTAFAGRLRSLSSSDWRALLGSTDGETDEPLLNARQLEEFLVRAEELRRWSTRSLHESP